MNKVIDKKLVLTGYTLDTAHFLSMIAAIKETKKPVIESVYLDNCGVDDTELSLFLQGLTEMEGF